jgi:3-oxoacyl-(acyl-carrier-protein) synthase
MPLAPDRRVVVTGLGLVLPQGPGLESAEGVFAGRSAVCRLSGIRDIDDATGAPVRDFMPPAGFERQDRAVQFAVTAASEAWAASGLAGAVDPARCASVISQSKGGWFASANHEMYLAPGEYTGGRAADDTWFQFTPDAAALAVARHLGLAGPTSAPVTACASGGHAMVWGARLIRRGIADVAVVGAAESSLHPMVLGSYRRMGVLAPAGDDPAASVRPFSATRRGFAIGEGAGILVLEAEESAEKRGVRLLARVAGWASGCQAEDMMDAEPGSEVLARLIGLALRRADLAAHDVDYIHAHGTATRQNDLAEARAIRAALGPAAAGVSVSSTKGSHGHLLGAATAVELVLAVLAMRRGEIPPTANLTDPDPEIGLDCTPLVARRRPVRHVVKIASGFGGQMLALVLSQP